MNRHYTTALSLLFLLFSWPPILCGEQSAMVVTEPGNFQGELLKVVLDDPHSAEKVREAYISWIMDYYARQSEILTEQRNVIRATNWISYVVCIFVHIILGICMWMAANEYREAGKLRSQEQRTPASNGSRPSNEADITELSASLQEISMKTARQGMVMFVLAILLYFLYISFVYPVTTIKTAGDQPSHFRFPREQEVERPSPQIPPANATTASPIAVP